jgi:putative peptidoglycan lipid II flippase
MTSATDQPVAPGRIRRSALLNTAIVAGGYLLSRVLGLARDVIISAQFGTHPAMDAYRATFNIIDLVYIVIAGGALGSAFIPIFAGFLEQQHEDDAWRLASSLLNLALVGLVAACAIIALLAHPIVALTVGAGFDEARRELTVQLLRFMLLQPILLGLGGLAKATLESFDRFTLPAIGSNLYNIGIIAGALVAPLFGSYAIYSLAGGVIVGAALFLLVQLPGLRGVNMRYMPQQWFDAPGLRQVGRLLGPRLFGQAAWQINLIAITSFASLLGTGAVAANGYALTLMLLPHGLLALSLGTVMFPQLTRLHAAGDHAGFRETALSTARQVAFVTLPAAAIMAAAGAQIVRALFERGAFTAQSTALTAEALVFYMLGLPAFAVAEIVVRSFYAMRDTRTPVLVGMGVVALNIGLGWTLLQLGGGLDGLALAFSIANITEATVLLLLLGQRLGGLGGSFWRPIVAMHVAALLCGAAVLALRLMSYNLLPYLAPGGGYRWPLDFVPLLLWVGVAAALGMAVYAGLAALLHLGELHVAVARFRRVAGRLLKR